MIEAHRINSLFDADVVDADGSRIGTVKHVYVDPEGGQPLFAGVATGWFGRSESFVPLRDADFDGETLHVQHDKETVKHAPRIDADGVLTDDDIDRIHDYYDDGDTDSGDADTRDAASVESAAADQRPARKRIRVHRYVITDERTATASGTQHDAASDRGRVVDETRYETVEDPGPDRLDESRVSAADESRERGGDELRRHRE
ncbi:PRC-barrel domain containing protein [Microbacterium esteraromaticum]|nr:PRC-barrel domain containing protein [Microbacterium esteraromaticum]